MKPKVTFKDITQARYVERMGKYYVKIYFSRKGENGAVEFGWFDTKQEAKEFYIELKSLKN